MSEDQPLVVERMLQAPSERVWQALTDYSHIQKWSPFIPAFEPEVGFKFQFELGSDKDHQFLHLCQVTEVVDGQKLTYSWRYDGHPSDSLLSYELFLAGDTTKLRVTWSGLASFPADPFKPEGFAEGTNYNLAALQKFVEA